VCPLAVKPRLLDLSREELSDLFLTAAKLQRTLQRVYDADAFNVAVQDGSAAGQSVPHVHCHVIPRKAADAGGEDRVHKWLEGEEGDVGRAQREAAEEDDRFGGVGLRRRVVGEWVKDEERRPRSMEEMVREARWLREEVERDEREGGGKL